MSISQRAEAAVCRVTAAGAFVVNDGFNTPVRTGAGVYTVKSDRTWDFTQCWIQAGVFGGAGNANVQVTTADGVNWAITTFVAAVATDEVWYLIIEPVFS